MNKQPSATPESREQIMKLVDHVLDNRCYLPSEAAYRIALFVRSEAAAVSETAAPPDRNAIIEECASFVQGQYAVFNNQAICAALAADLRALKNAAPQAAVTLATAYPPESDPAAEVSGKPAVAAFDSVQLSEARYYRESKDPIGILARAILRANGEMK